MEMAEVLKQSLNKNVKDIFVTGVCEVKNDYSFFTALLWWYYIEFEKYFLCVSSDETTLGGIEFSSLSKIQPNFEIEEGEIFTVTSINKENYSKIVAYDLFYGKHDSNLYGLGIKFKDNKYVFFDSISIHGIEISDKNVKVRYLEDSRFFMKHYPENR